MGDDYDAYKPEVGEEPMPLEVERIVGKFRHLRRLDEVSATLYIDHPSTAPEAITAELRVEPDSVDRAGDFIRKGSQQRLPTNLWKLGSKGRINSKYAEEHVLWLIQLFDGHLPAVRCWQQEGATMKIFVECRTFTNIVSLQLRIATLQELARIHIELDFTGWYENRQDDDDGDEY